MNLLEHKILKVHRVQDITDDFVRNCGYVPAEALLEVDLTYDCNGCVKRMKKQFWKETWKNVEKSGHFYM